MWPTRSIMSASWPAIAITRRLAATLMVALGASNPRQISIRSPICRRWCQYWRRGAISGQISRRLCTATGCASFVAPGEIRIVSWELTAADLELRARTVEPFLPDRIFDAHAHLVCRAHMPAPSRPDAWPDAPEELGVAAYFTYSAWLHPQGRSAGGLFFGLAFNGDRDANNRFVASEVQADQVRELVLRGGFVGSATTPWRGSLVRPGRRSSRHFYQTTSCRWQISWGSV